MNVITVIGAGGGVGATTVAAHLTAALVAQQRRCIAFDFARSNALRLHFGMEWSDSAGVAPQLHSGKPWHESAYRSIEGLDFVPHGRINARGEEEVCAWLNKRPHWFAQRLDQLNEEADALAICDCSPIHDAWRAQALSVAQLAVIVLAPDALSYAAAAEAAESVAAAGTRNIVFLVNGFDPSRALDRDVIALLRHDLPHPVSPVMIHRDEAVREALASSQLLFTYAPTSRAAYDFTAVASWIGGRFERQARVA